MEQKRSYLYFLMGGIDKILLRIKLVTLIMFSIIQGTTGHSASFLIENEEIFSGDVTGMVVPESPGNTGFPSAMVVHQPQQRTITGVVTDENGNPIPGVNVVVEGTTTGTVTDGNGKYTLEKPSDNITLVFSFIGYNSIKVPAAGLTTFNISLEPETKAIDEVVIVGYGVQKKESVVGAITQVGSEALVKSGYKSVTNAIAGKLSGVLTIQQTGQPGLNDAEIIVRGLSSWNSSAPLVLVDGVERDFSDLDPNEINTVSVLKDASATAVFGAKGANGVIIVTTKRGMLSKPQLSVSAAVGVDRATRIPIFIDSYTTMSMLNVARMNGKSFSELIPQSALNEYQNPSSRLNALRYPNNNWFEICTREFAPSSNANINVQGGTNFIKPKLSDLF